MHPPSALSRPWSVVVAKPKALIARSRTMAGDPLPDLRLLWSILASRLLHALTAVPGTDDLADATTLVRNLGVNRRVSKVCLVLSHRPILILECENPEMTFTEGSHVLSVLRIPSRLAIAPDVIGSGEEHPSTSS
jgi:hypothetical protein